MHESALSGCDRFGRWIASYAEDLPPTKSFLDVDYVNDELFWKGHFNQELEDIKERPYLGLQERTSSKSFRILYGMDFFLPTPMTKNCESWERYAHPLE